MRISNHIMVIPLQPFQFIHIISDFNFRVCCIFYSLNGVVFFSNAILSKRNAKSPVTIANNFSKFVLANKFPIVFNENITKRTHIATCATLFSFGRFNRLDLINTRKKNRDKARSETISNLNNCSTEFICPPHRKSVGAKSKNIIPIKMDR